ncbi:hypothetical protein A11A3_02707 [Alcanivorax hongdengensis A-11-3]|uniref:Lipoprotein n=1 Tax=Alcanivorax hongdengensis A-11-3 TaxID=1177179 RepID=L0WGA2_9GAMM|nr:hypothetical protein [Alcanivorax hongdengensis]EKF75744.1 hypothetical protein A11A3_02707 [Alcanivorax hongdengensis A-11-3]
MKLAALFPLVPVALLAGCQHFSYQAPTGDDTATVIFTSDDLVAQPVVCVPGEGFQSTEYALGVNTLDSKSIDEMLNSMKKATKVSTQVSAGSTRIGVTMNQRENDGSRDRCKVALQFDALKGARYQAHFTRSAGQCGLSLNDESGAPTNAVLVDWQCP